MLTGQIRRLVLEFVVGLPLFPGSARSALLRACGVRVGEDTRIRSRCVFTDSCVSFGDRTWVNFGVTFNATAPIEVGDDVQIAHGTVLTTATHGPGDAHRRAGASRNEPIRIGDGCWLGAGVMVLPGVTIGRGCVIAAGAVVTRDCDPDGLYAGVPAKRVRDLETGH
ncbi:MAG: acyltransferase [Solirubrobacteraceae bacterium]